MEISPENFSISADSKKLKWSMNRSEGEGYAGIEG